MIPVLFSLAITAACLFGSAGRLNWSNAWVLPGLSLVTGLALTVGRDPELAAERLNIEPGKSWGKVLVGITVPDRGHIVVDGGPYRFVRHPAYAGTSVFTLATPLILGSYWALAPAAATVSFVVLRTMMEDATLHDELDGYADYASRVRCRLLPPVW